jgi:WhiB family transcriptional regulator, redox-sensing transcriptional regulator
MTIADILGVDARAESWQEDSACSRVDPELFFPERQSPIPAKRVCAACPVMGECLQYALDNDERYGIWGGLTEHEVEAMRKARGIPRVPKSKVDTYAQQRLADDRLLPQYEALIARQGQAVDLARDLGITSDALTKRMHRARQRREGAA